MRRSSRMLSTRGARWFLVAALALVLAGLMGRSQAASGSSCMTSGPGSGYTVTVCIDQPATGAAVSGDVGVQVSESATGSDPGVRRMVFYLDGAYILTDYSAPYTFSLPTAKFADGTKTLEAEALMRDGFTSSRASVSLDFQNGNATPPPDGTGFTPTSGRPAGPGEPFVAAAAGDGASGEPNADAVTQLVNSWDPNLFLYLGDVYEKGTTTEFYNWYGQSSNYGLFRSVTNPTIGNHEYENGQAPGYFNYWDSPPNYYSTDANGWHVISLNSNSQFDELDPGTAQYDWLQNDLDTRSSACTLVFFHHPRYSIGPQGDTNRLAAVWSLLASKGVDVVLTGHDHNYQRWVPLDGAGNPQAGGITQFVVGTGGHGIQGFVRSDSRVAMSATSPGALRLVLNPGGASYEFVTTGGATVDAGSVTCSGATDTSPPQAPSNLTASVSGSQVDLSWSPALDDVGVTAYEIYRDGALLDTIGPTTSYTDTTAQPNSTYTYTVRARDGAGNVSPDSDPITVTTLTETTLFSDGFESGDLQLWTSATNIATQITDVLSGGWGLRANDGGGLPSWAWTQLPSTESSLYYRVHFKILNQGSTVNLFKFRTGTGSSILGVYVASNGNLGYRNDVASASNTSSTQVTQGSWHDLQVHVSINGSSGSTETWLDGVPIAALTRTENLGTTPVGRVQAGENSSGRSFDIVYDALSVNTAHVVDDSPPDMPTLTLGESSPNEYAAGTTLFYNPSGSNSGSFTVTAVSHDADSGVATIAFPSVFGSEATLDTASPHTITYSWTSGESVTGQFPVTATNGAGLSASDSFTVTPDTSVPSGGSIDYADGYTTVPSIAVQLSEGGDEGVGVDSDGETLERSEAPLAGGACGTFGPYVAIIDVPNLDYVDTDVSSGTCYRYRFVVPDLVGNQTVYTSPATAKVDALAPTASLDDPGASVSGTVDLTGSASDTGGSGVASVDFQYRISGSSGAWTTIATDSSAPYGASWDTTSIQDGVYDVRMLATDGAGNTTPSARTVVVDNTAALSISISSPRSYVNASDPDPYTITATSPDPLVQIEFFHCSDASTNCSSGTWESLGVDTSAPYSASWPVDADGLRALRAVGTDATSGTAEDIVNVTIDRTPPSGGSVGYTDGWNTSGSVSVTTDPGTDAGSGIASGSGVLQRDTATLGVTGCGAFPGTWTTAFSPDIDVQSAHCYMYRFQIADNAGNVATYASPNVVMVDTSPPTDPAGLTAIPASPTQVDLSWSPSLDDVAVNGYRIRRDGVVIATVGPAVTSYSDMAASPATSYTYTVQSFDQAGNDSFESAGAPATTPGLPPSTVTSVPVADAYVRSSSSGNNYGGSAQLRTDSSPDTRSYLRFSIVNLQGVVRKATLRVYATSNLSAGYEVHSVSSTTWSETGITYANAPAAGSLIADSGPASSGAWNEIDVTSVVNGNGDYSFALTPLSSTALAMSSREGANPPELVLELDTSGNRAPSAGDVSVAALEDTTGPWTPAVSDPDGDPLTCSITTAPAHGQATVAPDCSGGTYAPDPNYAGADSFTYQATDGSLSAEGVASVTVTGVNDPPVAANDGYSAVAGSTLNVDAGAGVLANDTDVDGDPLTATLATDVTHGTLNLNADGSFDYTPQAGFIGTDSFTYTASDGQATSSAATVTIDVGAAPSSYSFTAGADAYVNEGHPTSNYGSATALRIDASPSILRSYLHFDATGVVGTVTKATLRVYATSSSSDGYNVRPLATPGTSWSEGSITWANAPAIGGVAASAAAFTKNSWTEVDVTSLVNGNGSFDFVLTTPGTRAAAFESRDVGTHPPELVIDVQ